jgi:hypothetical protein
VWNLIAGAIIGIFGSIGTAIAVEILRRPKLTVSIEQPPLDNQYPPSRPAQNVRFLRVKLKYLTNPYRIGQQWMLRASALQCRPTITFHPLSDAQNVFGRRMGGRWSNSPEPVAIPVLGPQGQQFQILDLTRLTLESRIDIPPGETELLDIAVRADDDTECFGWNNEAYFLTPLWRNPNWRLDRGRYLVAVIITTSGQKFVAGFRLVNDVARADFRLEPITPKEKVKLLKTS